VRFDDSSLANTQQPYRDLCASYGLELIVPRSRAHAFAIRDWNGAIPTLVGVYPDFNGAGGLSNWSGRCQGVACDFWMSNSNNAGCLGFEPNGDNNTNDTLYLGNGGVCDYGHWNDSNSYTPDSNYVVCSTNDASPPIYASCAEILAN